MSDIVGFNLKPEENTPLSKMLEFGLTKYLDKLAVEKKLNGNICLPL